MKGEKQRNLEPQSQQATQKRRQRVTKLWSNLAKKSVECVEVIFFRVFK